MLLRALNTKVTRLTLAYIITNHDASQNSEHSGQGKHEHRHGDDAHHDHVHEADSQTAHVHDSQSHVHIRFLWFTLTLPDFSRQAVTEVPACEAAGVASEVETVSSAKQAGITTPFTLNRLVQILLLSVGPLPEHTRIPEQNLAGRVCWSHLLNAGQSADAPDLPPPEFTECSAVAA